MPQSDPQALPPSSNGKRTAQEAGLALAQATRLELDLNDLPSSLSFLSSVLANNDAAWCEHTRLFLARFPDSHHAIISQVLRADSEFTLRTRVDALLAMEEQSSPGAILDAIFGFMLEYSGDSRKLDGLDGDYGLVYLVANHLVMQQGYSWFSLQMVLSKIAPSFDFLSILLSIVKLGVENRTIFESSVYACVYACEKNYMLTMLDRGVPVQRSILDYVLSAIISLNNFEATMIAIRTSLILRFPINQLYPLLLRIYQNRNQLFSELARFPFTIQDQRVFLIQPLLMFARNDPLIIPCLFLYFPANIVLASMRSADIPFSIDQIDADRVNRLPFNPISVIALAEIHGYAVQTPASGEEAPAVGESQRGRMLRLRLVVDELKALFTLWRGDPDNKEIENKLIEVIGRLDYPPMILHISSTACANPQEFGMVYRLTIRALGTEDAEERLLTLIVNDKKLMSCFFPQIVLLIGEKIEPVQRLLAQRIDRQSNASPLDKMEAYLNEFSKLHDAQARSVVAFGRQYFSLSRLESLAFDGIESYIGLKNRLGLLAMTKPREKALFQIVFFDVKIDLRPLIKSLIEEGWVEHRLIENVSVELLARTKEGVNVFGGLITTLRLMNDESINHVDQVPENAVVLKIFAHALREANKLGKLSYILSLFAPLNRAKPLLAQWCLIQCQDDSLAPGVASVARQVLGTYDFEALSHEPMYSPPEPASDQPVQEPFVDLVDPALAPPLLVNDAGLRDAAALFTATSASFFGQPGLPCALTALPVPPPAGGLEPGVENGETPAVDQPKPL